MNQANNTSRRQKLELEADTLLLKICLQDSDPSEALLDFNFIKEALELQHASSFLNGYFQKSGKYVRRRSGYKEALENLIAREVVLRASEDRLQDWDSVFPATPNKKPKSE